MLCTKCGKNPAVVYYKQVINGKATSVALCAECAKSAGSTSIGGGDIWSGIFGGGVKSPAKVCPKCGMSFAEIRHSGRVGCAKCYEAFGSELEPTVTNLHGRVKHVGRAPAEFAAKRETQGKIESLKQRLSDAIASEKYEDAAKLRDEIKSLENGNN